MLICCLFCIIILLQFYVERTRTYSIDILRYINVVVLLLLLLLLLLCTSKYRIVDLV